MNDKQLAELWREGRERDNKLNQLDRQIDDAIHERNPATVPILASARANYEVIQGRELYTYLQLVMGQFKEKPRFNVNEINASNRSIMRADEDQRWLNTVIWEIERQQSDAVHRKVVGDLFRYGRAYTKVHAAMQLQGAGGPLSMDDDDEVRRWKKDYDSKRHTLPIPIAVRHVRPDTTHHWEDSGVGPGDVLEMRLRQVRELRSSYPDHKGRLVNYKDSDYVWWFEHQDRKLCTYGYAAGTTRARQGVNPPLHPQLTILRQWEHGYDRVSYVFFPGDESGMDEPSERWVSLLWPMLDLMEKRDSVLSQIATHVRATAWFYPILEMSEGAAFEKDEETGRPKSIDMNPFEWFVTMPGEKPSAFTPPPLTPDAMKLVERLDTLIQTHGLLPVLQGNVADYTSGYPLNQRMHAARARYNIISEHLKEGWAQLGHLLMKMVDVLNVPVAVIESKDEREARGAGAVIDMTPKRARQPRIITADWPLALPTDQALMVRIAREASTPTGNSEPLMSVYQARQQFMDDEQPELTSRMIEREQFRAVAKQSAIEHTMALVQQKLAAEMSASPTDSLQFNGPNATPGQMPGNPVAPGMGMPPTQPPPTGPVAGQFGGQSTNASQPLPGQPPLGGGFGAAGGAAGGGV